MAWLFLVLQLAPLFLGISAQSEESFSDSSISSTDSGSLSASQSLSAELPSLSGYPSCVSNCLALSIAAAECLSLVDVDCYCGSTNTTERFTLQMVACIEELCPNEHDSAQSLAQDFCDVAANSTSLSFPSSATTTPIPIPTLEPPLPSSSDGPSDSDAPTEPTDSSPPEETEDEGAALHHGMNLGCVALALAIGVATAW